MLRVKSRRQSRRRDLGSHRIAWLVAVEQRRAASERFPPRELSCSNRLVGTGLVILLLGLPLDLSLRGGAARLPGQQDHEGGAATFGLSAVWHADPFLFGGSFDLSRRAESLFTGKVRHLYVAAVAGASLPVAYGFSLQLLGEAGVHHISGTRGGPVRVPDSLDPNAQVIDAYYGTRADWTPFAGVRPSIELGDAWWQVGIGGWMRLDLRALAPEPYLDLYYSSPPLRGADLSRGSLGADLHFGIRFD
jgi:hypothetical protein